MPNGIFVIMFGIVSAYLGTDFIVAVSETKYVLRALGFFKLTNNIRSVT
jgi:hypothetical protein